MSVDFSGCTCGFHESCGRVPRLDDIWLAHLSMQSLPPSSSFLSFKDAPYTSRRAIYTMILLLETATLSPALSAKFVLFESVAEDGVQQHVSLGEALNFHVDPVHVRGPDGATILV